MKMISLWEPWATFISDGHKAYETRSWSTTYRGSIGIHAAKRWQDDQRIAIEKLALEFPQLEKYWGYRFPLGCVLVACELVAVHKTEAIRDQLSDLELSVGDYSDSRFAWELKIIRHPDKPIPAKGMQGIWNWEPSS